jgi:hypothetical protein
VLAATEALTLTGQQATIGRGANLIVEATTEALTLAAQAASVARDRGVLAATEALTFTGQAAAIARSRSIAGTTQTLALTAHAASVATDRGVLAATEALSIAGQAAVIRKGRAVLANAGALSLTAQAATVARSRGVIGTTQSMSLASFAALVGRGEVEQFGGHYGPPQKGKDYRAARDRKLLKDRQHLRELIERAAGLIEDAEEEGTQVAELKTELKTLASQAVLRDDAPTFDHVAVQARVDSLIARAVDDLVIQIADLLTDLIQEIAEED